MMAKIGTGDDADEADDDAANERLNVELLNEMAVSEG